MKTTKSFQLLSLLILPLLLANCGSATSETDSSDTDADESSVEGENLSASVNNTLSTLITTSSATDSNLSALVKNLTVNCETSGTLDVDNSSIVFDNCVGVDGSAVDGTITYVTTGSSTALTIDLSSTTLDSNGDTITMSSTGTLVAVDTGSAITVAIDWTTTINGDSYTITATDFSLSTSLILNGTLAVSVDITSTTPNVSGDVTCVFDAFDASGADVDFSSQCSSS